MTHALIFAGGTGRRMKSTDVPKQFLEVHGKPIIIYTIEHFEKHAEIDDIVVVCLESYIDELGRLIDKYQIKKVTSIVKGGDGGDKSIYNGLEEIGNYSKPDDIVLIHDGVRPLITEKLITDNIDSVRKYGSAITTEQAAESVVWIEQNNAKVPPRSEMFSVKAPQSFKFSEVWELYKKASEDGHRTIDSAHLCSIYGKEMYFVTSSAYNVKITKPEDYFVFRALFEAIESKQLVDYNYEVSL
jgi:2-C-methyl-D-erythritol 4-phosphate cytidylyltransferase